MSYRLEVKYNEETDDYFIEFPQDALDQVGWKIGDVIVWKDNGNGSYVLSKKVDHQAGDQEGNDPTDGAAKT
jgi:hypothetical protein